MNPTPHFRIAIINQLRQQPETPKHELEQSLFKHSHNKSTLRRGEVSLAFLSTFMQVQHVQTCVEEKDIKLQGISMTEPLQQFGNTTLKYEDARVLSKRGQVNKFYRTKMKEIQKDERSITALVGVVNGQSKPNQRLLSEVSETFERAKTFTTMPIVSKQGMSVRKKRQNSRRMEFAFQEFISKRSHTDHDSKSLTKQHQPETIISNRVQPQLKQSLNLSKFLKNQKVRGRKLATEYVKADRLTFNNVMSSAKSKKLKTTQPKQFRWTQLGNKALFNLKSNLQ